MVKAIAISNTVIAWIVSTGIIILALSGLFWAIGAVTMLSVNYVIIAIIGVVLHSPVLANGIYNVIDKDTKANETLE